MSKRTKQDLAVSLIELMGRKSLEHITVKDVVENCGLTRQTFYYYFQDIFALLEWIYREEAQQVIGENKQIDSWQEGFLRTLEMMRKNRVLVENTYRSVRREYLEEYMDKALFGMVMGVVEEESAGLNVKPEQKEFIAHFYSLVFIAVALDWVRSGMKEEPANLVNQIATLIEGDFRKALEKYAQ